MHIDQLSSRGPHPFRLRGDGRQTGGPVLDAMRGLSSILREGGMCRSCEFHPTAIHPLLAKRRKSFAREEDKTMFYYSRRQ